MFRGRGVRRQAACVCVCSICSLIGHTPSLATLTHARKKKEKKSTPLWHISKILWKTLMGLDVGRGAYIQMMLSCPMLIDNTNAKLWAQGETNVSRTYCCKLIICLGCLRLKLISGPCESLIHQQSIQSPVLNFHWVVKAVHLYGAYKPGHLDLYSVVAVVGEWRMGKGGHSLLPWSQWKINEPQQNSREAERLLGLIHSPELKRLWRRKAERGWGCVYVFVGLGGGRGGRQNGIR